MHQFDLTNTLTDAKLMADSIKNDIRGTSRKLALRQKKLDKDDLSAKVDQKVWEYVFKYLKNDIATANEKVAKLIKSLQTLSANTAKALDNFEGVLASIKKGTAGKKAKALGEVRDLKAELKDHEKMVSVFKAAMRKCKMDEDCMDSMKAETLSEKYIDAVKKTSRLEGGITSA